jgi:hypothetical protein
MAAIKAEVGADIAGEQLTLCGYETLASGYKEGRQNSGSPARLRSCGILI